MAQLGSTSCPGQLVPAQLRLALARRAAATLVIDADPDQVLKNIPADTPGYYNPRLKQNRAARRACHVDHQAKMNVSGNATTGPSSVTLDEDARMNTIQLNYKSNNSEDERMGPA